ncbi:MAG: carboxypeptidase-like regulatory domain-containing protein, partial [Planctomycetota bacterium]
WPDAPVESAATTGVSPVAATAGSSAIAGDEPATRTPVHEEPSRVVAGGAGLSEPEQGFALVRVVCRWTDGTPASEVGVFASQGRAITRREAVTGADGTAELLHLAPGSWSIGATLGTSDGIAAGGTQRCVLAAGEAQVVELVVQKLVVAKGRVVDGQGRPVADARVWVSADGDGNLGHEVARTAADGAFETPILGAHYLGARKQGFAPSHVVVVNPMNLDTELVLQLLHEGGAVRGFVRDDRGQPIAWAKVRVGQETVQILHSNTQPRREHTPCGVDVTTAADGSFFVDAAAAGLVSVHVGAKGFAPKQVPVDVPLGGTGRCEIVLERGARVRGTIRDTNGEPVASATVRLRSYGEFAGAEVESAADGSYVLSDLPAGTLPVEARLGGARAQKQIPLAVGEEVVWDPVLGTSFTVRGRVVDERGGPLAGFEVAAWHGDDLRSRSESGSDGTFALDEVGADELVLEVSAHFDSLRKLPGVKPGTEDLVVVVDGQHLPSATITGRLLDERGQPVTATLVPWHPDSNRARHHKTDPSTGVYRIGPVRPGRYALTVESEGFGRVELGKHDLAPNQVLDLGDRVLKTPGTVEVEVVLAGRPAAGGVVVFWNEKGQWLDSTPIEHGKAVHRALPAERVSVYAEYQDAVQFGEVDVAAGAIVPLRLELHRPFRATIHLVDPRGATKEDLKPVITPVREDGSRAGRFEPVGLPGDPTFFVELPPAVYVLKVSTADGRSLEERIDLRSGHLERTLRLPQ